METTTIVQIIEAIKTLNLNINSETALEIAQTIRPLMFLWLLGELIKYGSLLIIVISMVILAYKLIKYALIKEYENK